MLPSSGPAKAQGAQHCRRARRYRDEEEYDVFLANYAVNLLAMCLYALAVGQQRKHISWSHVKATVQRNIPNDIIMYHIQQAIEV